LWWLTGCESSLKTTHLSESTGSDSQGIISSGPETTGTVATVGSVPPESADGSPIKSELLGGDPNDNLSLGKRHYREQNYGLAEKYFRRTVEAQPRTAEAWVGLAASYDRLRRFDLADHAYEQAIAILGPTPEILNNQGYSYMLRGDYKMARKKLTAAQSKDPDSQYIQSNLVLLDEVVRKGKGIR
jgi:Flp pilus assembly protein TadD